MIAIIFLVLFGMLVLSWLESLFSWVGFAMVLVSAGCMIFVLAVYFSDHTEGWQMFWCVVALMNYWNAMNGVHYVRDKIRDKKEASMTAWRRRPQFELALARRNAERRKWQEENL